MKIMLSSSRTIHRFKLTSSSSAPSTIILTHPHHLHHSRSFTPSNSASSNQTSIEKIIQKFTVDLKPNQTVSSGDFIILKPQHVMTHDNTAPVISKFNSIGASKISDPHQPVFTIDHDVQNKSPTNLKKYATIEAFAHQQTVDFFPPGRGIGHQIMIEEGYAFPGSLMVASDSHSNMYGGVGCLGTPVVRTDAAAIWATQRIWWQVPEIVRVELKGSLPIGVTGKDIIVALCGNFNKDEVLNTAIEFVGDGIKQLTVDERLAISNMTTEWGALAGVFPIDGVLIDWYKDLLSKREASTFIKSNSIPSPSSSHPRLNPDRVKSLHQLAHDLRPDPDAHYSKTLTLDLKTLVPHVSGPNSVKVSTPLPVLESQNIAIQKAYLVSCVNSRLSDLQAAAKVMKGKEVAAGVEFYVAAASSLVQAQAESDGTWATLLDSGAKFLPAGCGPCIGLGVGLLEKGEVGISATNRNYKGRMGSPLAQAYLASPAVVAASALAGKICGPPSSSNPSTTATTTSSTLKSADPPQIRVLHHRRPSSPESRSNHQSQALEGLLPSFPTTLSGPLIFVPNDNINTDGIYPGKYTYQDHITADQQAQVVMENYDPNFAGIVRDLYPSSPEPSLHAKPKGIDRTREDGNLTDRALSSRTTGRGVILSTGSNFGTGSSREQAATALKNSGVSMVISGSLGEIFKRNSINNGLICLESIDLLRFLRDRFPTDPRDSSGTIVTGWRVSFDCRSGVLSLYDPSATQPVVFQLQPIGRSVQEIFVAGGLEGWVRERI